MPINMYLTKKGASVELDSTKQYRVAGIQDHVGDTDEFCGFPHLPSAVQLAVIDWGEFYGD